MINEVPMPRNIEAEQAILGAILLDGDNLIPCLDYLHSSGREFSTVPHRAIFRAAINLFNRSQEINTISVLDFLAEKNFLNEVGGGVYLASLMESVPQRTDVQAFSKIVRDKYLQREFWTLCSKQAEDALQRQSCITDTINGFCEKLLALGVVENKNATTLNQCLKRYMDSLFQRVEQGNSIIGIPTGFRKIDQLLGGMLGGNLYVIAGRPGMGKTSLLNCIQRNSAKFGYSNLFFSLEMPEDQITQRYLSLESGISLRRLSTGELTNEQIRESSEAAQRINDLPILIDDRPARTITEIRASVRLLKPDLVSVDYLQKMKATDGRAPREQQINEMISGLKDIAKESKIPFIVLSQLNRKVEERTNKRPLLSDLRESGTIEQEADAVGFLYRDEYYNENSEERGVAEFDIAKHRNGPTGFVKLAWIGECTKFGNLQRD